jgi:hypothetical protein
MRALELRVGVGHLRSGLSKPVAQSAEQALALPCAEAHSQRPAEKGRQGLAIPDVRREAEVRRASPENAIDPSYLLWTKATWPARPVTLRKATQPLLLKAIHPVLHGAWRIPQQTAHLRTRHALGHQQHSMKPMVIPGVRSSSNLILQTQDHALCIRHKKWSHVSLNHFF